VRPKLQLARALADLGTAYDGEQLGLLEEAARLVPRDPDVKTELGVYFLQHGDPGRALEQFQRVIELEAATPQTWANRGAALYLLGRADEATRDFEAALLQDPCNFDARNNLILVRRTAGDTDAVRRLAVIPEGCRFSTKQQVALDAAQP
jgi:Flp pilus assembly protein TadD